MLRDLIYSAWVKSAEPVPEWKPRPETHKAASCPCAAEKRGN